MPKIPIGVDQGKYQTPQLYIGIDPGQAGGLVCIYSSGEIEATPMPQTELQVWEWFANLPVLPYSLTAVIEKVHSMPNQSAQSGFTFGKGFGGLKMALTAKRVPYEEISPQTWMKALGITPKKKDEAQGKWKTRLLTFAQQLYPNYEWPKAKGYRLAIADALLIATFCQRKNEGKL